MCGIAGILRFDQERISAEALQSILEKIAHRGRDHQGMEIIHPYIALGHRRLSIIDLQDQSNQPMYYGKRLCMTYNGEIYNYRELKTYLSQHQYQFKTNSDTEVLLAAYDYWGEACVNYLNGMFAFAIWDEQKQQLFCARDHLGIKPFYYLQHPRFFVFASESRALAPLCNHELNATSIFSYLLTMYVPTQTSIYQHIQQLLPAHTLIINTQQQKSVNRYWQLHQFETCRQTAIEEHKNKLRTQLKTAIKNQLQSDVPVGGFLSGGIDSGMITAMAASECKTYHTYSIGYEGLGNNELPAAKRIAERYATHHTEVMVSAETAMCALNRALQHISEPIADPAIVGTYILADYAARDGVKVLLNGTGGDEVFSGYTRYTGERSRKRQWFMRLPQVAKLLFSYLPISSKTKLRLLHMPLDMLFSTGGSYSLADAYLRDKTNVRTLLKQLAQALTLPFYSEQPLLYQRMLFDLHTYLPNELLFLLDQMTMTHTIEGRVPLLDIDLVASAFQFQAEHHLKAGQTKAILKEIATPYLGRAHVQQKKQGFAGSSYWWVNQYFDEFITGIADTKFISGFEHFDINAYCNRQLLNLKRANEIFILYCLNLWHKNASAY